MAEGYQRYVNRVAVVCRIKATVAHFLTVKFNMSQSHTHTKTLAVEAQQQQQRMAISSQHVNMYV